MEELKEIHNHFEAGSNCQVFQATEIKGCVFAMPGSTVNMGKEDETKPADAGADDVLRDELMPIFYNNDKEVRDFIARVRDARATDITALVSKLVSEKKVSDISCKKPLWEILHRHDIYPRSERTWDMQVFV